MFLKNAMNTRVVSVQECNNMGECMLVVAIKM